MDRPEGKNEIWRKQIWLLKKATMQELQHDRNGKNISIRHPCVQNLFNLKKCQQNSCFMKRFVSVNEPPLSAREQTLIHRITEWIRLEKTFEVVDSNL